MGRVFGTVRNGMRRLTAPARYESGALHKPCQNDGILQDETAALHAPLSLALRPLELNLDLLLLYAIGLPPLSLLIFMFYKVADI